MSISHDEARESLDQVADAAERTRKLSAYARVDRHLIVWGVIWFLGFCGDQFLPGVNSWIWLGLIVSGFAASSLIGMREPVRSRGGKRILMVWLFLYAYVFLWGWLLWPFLVIHGQEQTVALWKNITTILATVPMFAYVLIGLWLESFLIWVGLVVTALTVLGLFVAPQYFYLWLAATGGGILVGTGLYIHNRWR